MGEVQGQWLIRCPSIANEATMLKTIFLPLVRHTMTGFAAYLVTVGYITSGDTEMVVGIGVGLASLAFAYVDRYLITRSKKDE